jgi:hypothetical protein
MESGTIVSRAERVVADLQARGHSLCLAYAGAVLAFRCQDAAVAEWIRQFCAGYLTPSAETVEDVGIYATADSALLAALRSSAPDRPLAGKYEYLEVPLTDSVTLVSKGAGKGSPYDDVYLLLFREQRRILLVTAGDLEVQREEGMQVLRAAGKWLLLERGWVPMHSACAAKNGRAVCVAGQKASGKTSTLLNLLARNGCDLVAPDKFLLRENGQGLEVCGVPGKIGVRVGSVVVQPRLLDWLAREEASFFPHLAADEVQRIAETNTPEQLRNRKEKIPLLPTELAGLFGGSIVPTAPLGLILLPVFDPDLQESRLVRVEPDQAIAELRKCYVSLLSKAEGFLLAFFDLHDAVLEQRLAVLLDEHLPGVAAYEVHQSHTTNEQTADLVAGLL